MPAETDETGVVENVEPTGDESSSVADDADDIESTGDGADVPVLTRPRVLAGLLVAVVLAAATAVLLGAHVGRDTPPAESTNDAFVDEPATKAVVDAVSRAVPAVFTIDPKTVRTTSKAAGQLLAGQAVEQYRQLYGPILEQATGQGLTITTTVRATGVTALRGGRAELLVLADQTARAPSRTKPQVGPAHLKLVAELDDGRWRITSFEVL